VISTLECCLVYRKQKKTARLTAMIWNCDKVYLIKSVNLPYPIFSLTYTSYDISYIFQPVIFNYISTFQYVQIQHKIYITFCSNLNISCSILLSILTLTNFGKVTNYLAMVIICNKFCSLPWMSLPRIILYCKFLFNRFSNLI
jgi:hypothetical protein